ncbi:uncharacterized protein LOC126745086 isoform X2 [Anthonomus grandis grandis]|uniref:uncharacterized protein LOC126745086 isoform X2 n=1 Tax=Anthonomus grandis grandis TaxID=2921223 RepID=UPI002164FC6F|nr:uncharacterized protein LOC126745086 isoform X2 [Anthonomus grandis grandis]
MSKIPQSRVTFKENFNIVIKCPCSGSGHLVRRNERPVLANIQGEAIRNQHLSVQNHATRRKSDSCYSKISPSANVCFLQRAESTISLSSTRKIPTIKEPTKTAIPQYSRTQRHLPTRSSSISSYDSVYNQHQNSHAKIATETSTIKRKQVANCCSTTSNIPIAASTFLQSAKQSASSETSLVRTNNRCPAGTNHEARNLTSQPSGVSSGSALRAGSINSTVEKTLKPCCSSEASAVSQRGCSSTSQKRNGTLPPQHFVTLTQDSLNPTAYSEIDSLVVGKVTMVRNSSFIPVDITPNFVDGKKYFKAIDQGKCASTKTVSVVPPIDVVFPVRRSNIISDSFSENDGTRRPAVKMSLRAQNKKNQAVFPLLYSPQYIEDIIAYSDSNKFRFLIQKNMMEAYMHKRQRNVVANWLLQLCDFAVPQFSPIYYMSVRLFDYSIIRLKIRSNYYQLVAAASFWIAVKYLHQDKILKVSKLQAFCKGHCTKGEIYSMEKKILGAACFCLNMADPLDFLYYFLKMANLETVELLLYGSEYILQCATLFETYCTTECRFIAACSVYFALTHCCPDVMESLYQHLLNVLRYSVSHMEQFIEEVLKRNLRIVITDKLAVYEHFMRAERLYVAKFFKNL